LRSVNVQFLRPGQVVANAVTNPSGAVLCPMGYTLTEQAISRLRRLIVGSVWIEGNIKPTMDIAAREAELEKRFAGVADPVLLGIKAILDKRLQRLRDEYGA
jgi:hypothetical protein